MKYTLYFLALLGWTLSACNNADKQPVAQPETAAPESALLGTPVLDVDPVLIETPILSKPKPIDTRITADMIKDISFDVKQSEAADVYSDKPFNLNPTGNKQISITPKLYLEEDETIKQSYRDYINGGEVQVEVKFD